MSADSEFFQKEYPKWSRHLQGLQERYVNSFDLEINGRKISVEQSNVLMAEDLGNTVWDGSLVLFKYFCNEKVFPLNFWKEKRIIELGSGTGIVGAVLAALSPKEIFITDKSPQTDLIAKTVKNSGLEGENVKVCELLWGTDVSSFNPPFDIIVASECIYYDELVEPLIHSLINLSDKSTVIYLSYEAHTDEIVETFMTAATKLFNVEKVKQEDFDPVYRSEIINVAKLTKK